MVKMGLMWRLVFGLVVSSVLLGSAWADKSADACPGGAFPEFVKRFGENPSLQRSATSHSLHWQRMDINAQPEPKPNLQTFNLAQLPFPLMPSAAERQRASLVLDVSAPGSYVGKVTLHKPDTDFLVNYFFIKKACWSLVRIDDWSL